MLSVQYVYGWIADDLVLPWSVEGGLPQFSCHTADEKKEKKVEGMLT